MALTHDEENEILELYARGYSGRKIAGKSDHSEVTVYKIIRLARERVANLIEEGRNVDQITGQLDYPDLFVNHVIRESEMIRKEDEKDELKAEEFAEEIELSNEVDVKTDWADFQRELELEQRKDQIREKTNKFIKNLKLWEEHLSRRIVLDTEWGRRQKAKESELANFVLDRIDDIDTIETLSDLESISEGIFGNINTLINKYKTKAERAENIRIAQEKHAKKHTQTNYWAVRLIYPCFLIS